MASKYRFLETLWDKYLISIFNRSKYSPMFSLFFLLSVTAVVFLIREFVPEITFLLFGLPIVYNNIVFSTGIGLTTTALVYTINLFAILPYITVSNDKFNTWEILLGSLLYYACCVVFSYMIKREKLMHQDVSNLAKELAASAESLAKVNEEISELYTSTIKALAAAIEAKDFYTRGHSERVTNYSLAIARELNLPTKELRDLLYAAILHDIGKIGINESILVKPSRLTEEEFAFIKCHPEIGANILSSIKVLEPVIPIVYHHHEYFNGKGYPDNLVGAQIPLGARILAVADSFDAMTTNRPYRKGLDPEVALAELNKGAGTQFDPEIIKVFNEVFNKQRALIDKQVRNQDVANFSGYKMIV